MNADFVPFSAPKIEGTPPHALPGKQVITNASTAVPFLPLAQRALDTPPSQHPHGEPEISLERQGNRVTRIKVHCPCGNIIELACEY